MLRAENVRLQDIKVIESPTPPKKAKVMESVVKPQRVPVSSAWTKAKTAVGSSQREEPTMASTIKTGMYGNNQRKTVLEVAHSLMLVESQATAGGQSKPPSLLKSKHTATQLEEADNVDEDESLSPSALNNNRRMGDPQVTARIAAEKVLIELKRCTSAASSWHTKCGMMFAQDVIAGTLPTASATDLFNEHMEHILEMEHKAGSAVLEMAKVRHARSKRAYEGIGDDADPEVVIVVKRQVRMRADELQQARSAMQLPKSLSASVDALCHICSELEQ